MIGATLAHFRITAKLGEGGMGEVWRAEDSRLGRQVAIKVLPERFVADPDRLARFEREARVLASLSHPNIAGIYEVGEATVRVAAPGAGAEAGPYDDRGSSSGRRGGAPPPPAGGEAMSALPATPLRGEGRGEGSSATPAPTVHFLVMELAEGETLAERLARGPIPLAEALPIALQVAEAMEAAHERGIVHRDLKPGNVMVDARDRVKVLDFGLARALEPEPGAAAASGLTHSPTMTYQATMAGVLLGTAAYMSPEQAAGKPADRRADIWAFGVVVLEMLTGRRLFEGETVSHVLAGVLKDEPDWSRLAPQLPAPLRRLLARCLRKDPQRRLQSIGDARVALEDVRAGAASGVEETAITAAAVPQGAARWLPWVVAGAVALAAALVLVRGLAAPQHAVEGPLRFELALPKGAHLALDHQHDMMAISADGRRQVFLVRGEDGVRALALRDLGQATARMLPGTAGASTPAFSPDGEWVAFVAGNRLWKVPVAGGAPVVVAEPVADPRGLAWSPDGHLYLAPDFAASLRRVGDGGGSLEPVTELDAGRQERTHRWPHALPGGGVVLFTSDTVDSTEFYDDARIEALRVATGERTVVVEQASRARYVSGHLVFARGGSLYAAPFDAEALRVTGPPAIVLQGVSTTVASGAAHFAVSEEGSLFYVPGEVAAQAASVPLWLDREGGQEASTIAAANYDQLALSPDGRRVALVLQQGGSNGLWVADLQRGTLTRLTFAGSVADPVWSPDGLSIAYGGADGVYRQPSDGSGEPERLWGPRSGVFPSSFSPDGSVLIVEYGVDQGQGDLGVLDLGAPEEPTPVVQGPAHEWMGEVSPDGRWLAYVSVESGRPEVYVRPVQGRGGKWQVSVESGFEPRWSPEGGELFYRSGVGDLFAVPLAPGETFAPGPPTRLLSGMRSGDNARTYSVGPDGSRFLTLGLTVDGHVDRLNLVLGWDGEVARIAKRHGSR